MNSNEKYIVLADKLWKEKLDVSNENVFQETSNDANKTVELGDKDQFDTGLYQYGKKPKYLQIMSPISSCETFDRTLKVCYKII